MKKILVLLFPFLLGGLLGCTGEMTPAKFMVFDSVEYVEEFPFVYELPEKKLPDIDVMGINDFRIVDSMIVFSLRGSDSLWSIYSLSEHKLIGRCFTKGNGPEEFVQSPRVAFKTDFFSDGGSHIAIIYDFQTGKVVKVDISASLESHENMMSILCDTLPPYLFNFIAVDDSSFFCKEAEPSHTRQIRFMAGRLDLPVAVKRLNEAVVDDEKDINIISTISKMNHANRRIVEMPIGLNYVNIYSLSGDFAKTICIGNKLDDIADIEEKENDRIYTYADLRVYEDFWGVVSVKEDMKTFQTDRKKYPSILLFDWEGKPLAELKLNRFVNSFDIDLIHNTLYVFDVYDDEIFTYDITGVFGRQACRADR